MKPLSYGDRYGVSKVSGTDGQTQRHKILRLDRIRVPTNQRAMRLLFSRTGCIAVIVLLVSSANVLPRAVAAVVVRSWDSFYGVAFAAPRTWYVVGSSGALLNSLDGGRTWSRRELARQGAGSFFDLFSVQFARDGLNGWISGERGVVLHTTDGGTTWEQQQTGIAQNLLHIVAIDPRHACAVGTNGTILNTADGGKIWHLTELKSGLSLFDVDFSGRNGWAVGEFQTILHTADAGSTWEVQSGGKRADFESSPYFSVHFLDSQHGWVTAQGGAALWTSNGGNTWTKVALPSQSEIFAVAENTATAGGEPMELWMAGENGALIVMPLIEGVPSNLSHPSLYRPTLNSLADLAFSGRVGIAVGIQGTILLTTDGGRNWQKVRQ